MKQSFILFFILFAFCRLTAQNEPIETADFRAFCGSDMLPQDQKSALLFNERLQQFRNNKSENAGKGGTFDYTIPVVIYEVNCFANKPDLITPQQAEGQIAVLNQVFNQHGIQFCLATKDGPNDLPGDPLPGLIRVNAYPLCQPNVTTDWANVVALSNLPSERYLRIFVTRALLPPGVAGAASFPWTPANDHAILIRYDFFGSSGSCGGCNLNPGYERGHVLVHEVGHYLGLYHTFRNGCGMPGDPCNVQGDMICDTPPDGLAYFGLEDCPANPANYICYPGADAPLVNNFMTYTNDDCRNSFTKDQVELMKDVLDVDKPILFSQDNLDYTGVNCTPTLYCNIHASNSTPCVNTPVVFDNFPYNDATYTWNFGDMSPTGSTLPVEHTYTQPGRYTVTLTIERNGVTSTCEHEIFVTDCHPINSSQGLWYFGYFGGLEFSTGTAVAELSAYNNFTILTDGGSVVQADGNNDLLFYTDGINLYDGAHQQVNSSQLFDGWYGSSQAGISVPVPGHTDRYYFFQPGSTGQLIYSVITNTGSGISLSMVNTPVPSIYSDYAPSPITAIPICDGSGYWVLVARSLYPTTEVHVYRVNTSGISLATVFSSISSNINVIKASPDGKQVILCGGPFTVCDFDGLTGTLSHERKISNYAAYGSFSPNSNLVYSNSPIALNTIRICQYRVDVPDPSTTEVILEDVSEVLGSLQIGPDGKIYVARNGRHQVAVIHYPDVISTAGNNESGFTIHGPMLLQPTSRVGLPNFIDAGASECDPCANEITVEKECRQGNGRYYAHVTLYYQGVPISMYNDPNCCVTWEYVNGIPTLPCPRPNWAPNQNFNPMNLSQGQHYKVTIICGDCTYVEEDYIDCDPNRPGMGKPGLFEAEKEAIATIYPNPAQNEIAVRLKEETGTTENCSLTIVDAYGREVLRHPLLGNTDWQVLDISGFTPGVYAWYLVGANNEKVVDQGKIVVIP